MFPRSSNKAAALAFAAASFALPALACGPFFPNQLLPDAHESVLWSPTASFGREIDRLTPPARDHRAIPPDEKGPIEQSITIDLAELRKALAGSNLEPAAQAALLDQYEKTRRAIAGHFRTVYEDKEKGDEVHPIPFHAGVAVPPGLPREFELYLQGLLDLALGKNAAARRSWQTILLMPPAQRRYRTVWAAFMIGKSYLGNDSQKALEAFQEVRRLASQGASDPLGLSAASLGWEARAELDQHHEAAAVHLYMQQRASGDPTALNSLQFVAQSLFGRKNPKDLTALAADPIAAPVLTAYLLSQGGPYRGAPSNARAKAWLAAIEASGIDQIIGADRLAWTAYQAGDIDAANRWIGKAPADSPITQWISAKLLLRAGKIPQAAAFLAKAAQSFPANEQWDRVEGGYESLDGSLFPANRARGELGVIELSRGDYADALDHLLTAGWWLDAAYVAERVLTENELIAFVDRKCPKGTHPELRHLLARRLTRVGRWKEARPYFPDAITPKLDSYVTAIQQGNDKNLPRSNRAAALWAAARLARYDGMELMGTELAPDDFGFGGSRDAYDMAKWRREHPDKLIPPTSDELRRAAQSAPHPQQRWHYRYTAMEHAWAAAELMPDETDALARVLCEAGNWVKAKDPEAADRFYQALVKRCKTTAIGKEAIRRRWLPDLPPSKTGSKS